MKTIKIARIISRLNVGGPAQHAIWLSDQMNEGDWHTKLISGVEDASEKNMLQLAETKRVEVSRIKSMRRSLSPVRDLMSLVALVRILRAYRPDIVHTHTAKAGGLGRLAALLSGRPATVHTFHGHVLSDYFQPMLNRVFILIERILSRFTDVIITLTPDLEREISDYGISGRKGSRVIPLGLDLERFRDVVRGAGDLRRQLRLPEDIILLGMIGRLVPIKRHVDLFEALSILKKSGNIMHLAVIGGGDLEADLRQRVADLELGNQVHFCGFRSDLERLYPDLDLVVLTSANEGMPLCLIEAMACGVPVVATGVGGVPNLLSDCPSGKVVPPSEPQVLAQTMKEMIDGLAGLRQPAESYRAVVFERYSLGNLIQSLQKLYCELLEDE